MKIDQLLKMVAQIDGFFRSEPDDAEAIKNIADHVNNSWDPRMRSKVFAYVNAGGAGLSPRALAAMARLKPTSPRFQMSLEVQEAPHEDIKTQAEAFVSALVGR